METPVAKAVLCLGQTIVKEAHPESIKILAEAITLKLWLAVEELRGKKWSTQAKEKMWLKFAEVRSEESLMSAWTVFLEQFSVACTFQEKMILFQHILEVFLEQLVKELLKMEDKRVVVPEPLSENELQALRYCAGYIPYKLIKHYKKLKGTETAAAFISTLESWAVIDEDTDGESYLAFTMYWVDKQNRGGLFRVNDAVFVFFKRLEMVARSNVTISRLMELNDTSLQVLLMEKIASDKLVQDSWQSIAGNALSATLSSHLFNHVLKCWIKMRCEAFLKVFMNTLVKNRSASMQKEKGLRKELKK